MRTVNELLARAEELRRMAQTARTADMSTAFITLAERFEALAHTRSVEQGDLDQSTDDQHSGGCRWNDGGRDQRPLM
jgi:hypothetical protein